MCNGESIGLLKGIRARRSCRAFKITQVDNELLKSVLKCATHAPSAKNAQPWEVYVVTGKKLEQLKSRCQMALENGETAALKSSGFQKEHLKRSHELNVAMRPFIEKQGWQSNEFIKRCLAFFGAPVAIVICLDEPLNHFQKLDIGAFMQTLALSATGHGLSTCLIGYTLIVEKAIAEVLALPPTRRIMVTLAMGYADETQPMAQFQSSRVPLEENIRFLE